MKKKGRKILIAAGILVPTVLGFALGYSSGVSINDDTRIRKELSRVELEEPIQLGQVARGSDGKVELKILEEYLERYQEQVFVLRDCNEELRESAAAGKEIAEPRKESLRKLNEEAYGRLGDLVHDPKEYIMERIQVYGTEYETWRDEWAEALKVVQCKKAFEEKYTLLYEENKAYLE